MHSRSRSLSDWQASCRRFGVSCSSGAHSALLCASSVCSVLRCCEVNPLASLEPPRMRCDGHLTHFQSAHRLRRQTQLSMSCLSRSHRSKQISVHGDCEHADTSAEMSSSDLLCAELKCSPLCFTGLPTHFLLSASAQAHHPRIRRSPQ